MVRRAAVERKPLHVKISNKPKLEAIEDYYHKTGSPHLSMTRIIELLIDKEHKRMKLK